MRDQHFQVGECGTEPVGVATPVSGQRFGLWKGIDHERRTLMIAHFPLAQQPTLAVANRVPLRVQTALVRRIHSSEEHTSELPSLMRNSSAVFCLKKKTQQKPSSTLKITTKH